MSMRSYFKELFANKGTGSFAFLMVLFLISAPVFAQDQPQGDGQHQPPSTADIVAKMQSKLNLTQDQVGAVSPIIEKYSSKWEELRQSMQDGTANRDSMRSQMKGLKEDEKQDLSQFLSADQLSQWEQMQSQPRQHKHGSGGNSEGTGNINENGSNSGSNGGDLRG